MKLKQLALITTPEPRLARRATVRCRHRSEHREGAERIEDRHHARGRRKNYSAADSGIVRRTAQRSGAIARQNGGRSACARVRSNRRAALDETKKLKASGGLSEDGMHEFEAEVQKLTDRFVKSVDTHLEHKEAEIMKV